MFFFSVCFGVGSGENFMMILFFGEAAHWTPDSALVDSDFKEKIGVVCFRMPLFLKLPCFLKLPYFLMLLCLLKLPYLVG